MRGVKRFQAMVVLLCLAPCGYGQSGEAQRTSLTAYAGCAGVVEAFKNATIVALPDRHQDSNSSRFRIGLVSCAGFAGTVNDIVIEWGNRLYQPTLDRYIAGESVAEVDLQRIWRNTTVIDGLWDSPVYRAFLSSVRSVNLTLPTARRMRVLAGDPPIDWDTVQRASGFLQFAGHRDESVAEVIDREVLARHRKALLIMGGGHFSRGVAVNGRTGVIDLLERAHPSGKVLVVGVTPSLNQELRAYPPESFFFSRGSWLEGLSSARGTLIYDGILTLPDGDRVRPDPATYRDPAYFRALDRRWRIVRGEGFSPDKVP